MNVGSMTNENEPCRGMYAEDLFYVCKTASGLIFEMKSVPLENTIVLRMKEKIYGKFAIPIKENLLIDAEYIKYTYINNWIILDNRDKQDILTKLKETK